MLLLPLGLAGCRNDSERAGERSFDSLVSVCESSLLTNANSALVCSAKLYLLALASGQAEKEQRASRIRGMAWENAGIHDSAKVYFRNMYNISARLGDTFGMANACTWLANSFSSAGFYDSAHYYRIIGKRLAIVIGDSMMISVFTSSMGTDYLDRGIYDSAQRCFIAAAEYFERVSDTHNLAQSYRNLGLSLMEAGFLPGAARYFKKAYRLNCLMNNNIEAGLELNQLGIVYKKMNSDSAEVFFLEGIQILDRSAATESQMKIRFNYANYLKNKGKLDEAEDIYRQVLQRCTARGIVKGALLSMNMLAKVCDLKGNHTEAAGWFEGAVELADKNGFVYDLKRLYREIFEFYLGCRDVERAGVYFRKWEKLSDSLEAAAGKEAVAHYQQLYETEKKEKENAALEQRIEIKNRTIAIYLTSGILLILFLFSLLMYYRQKLRISRLIISNYSLQIEKAGSEIASHNLSKANVPADRNFEKKMHEAMVVKRLWQNPSFSLNRLSEELKMPPRQVSESIRNHYRMNFSSLVNFHRVEEACRLLSDGNHRNFKMEAIGLKSGFANRQNFYSCFRKLMNLTPAEYQERQLKS